MFSASRSHFSWRACAIALVALGALVAWTAQTGGLPEPWGTRIGQALSREVNFVYEALCIAFLLFGPLAAREKRAARMLWALGAGLSYAVAVEGGKRLFFWPRPIDFGRTSGFVRGSGFPSGHTVPAFLAATLVGYLEPRLRVPAFTFAVLIAYSRVEVTAHFASQVWLSACIGIALGWAWSQVRDKRLALAPTSQSET